MPGARGSDSTGLGTQHRGLGFALVPHLPHCRCGPASHTLWMGTRAGRCDQDLDLPIVKSGWVSHLHLPSCPSPGCRARWADGAGAPQAWEPWGSTRAACGWLLPQPADAGPQSPESCQDHLPQAGWSHLRQSSAPVRVTCGRAAGGRASPGPALGIEPLHPPCCACPLAGPLILSGVAGPCGWS